MKLRRLENPRGWTAIPNSAIEDRDLSWRARGLLGYLLSRPDGWTTDSERLSALAGQPGEARSKRAEGREAVRTALRELEAARYLHRVKRQLPAGSSEGRGGTWTTDYFLFDTPTESVEAGLVGSVPLDSPPGDKPVDNLGTKTRPASPGRTSVDWASLTTTTNHKKSSAQAGPPSSPGSPVDNEELSPLAAASSDVLQLVSRLEPAVEVFALRAHLAAVSTDPPALAALAALVLQAHHASPPSRAGSLTTADVLAWQDQFASTESAASSGGLQPSGSAAPLTGGLPAADAGSAGALKKSKGAKSAKPKRNPV